MNNGSISKTNAPTFATQRRHDVDWLRVMALGLLIIYHVALSFQPWASKLLFIQNEESLPGLWIVMSMINVWRLPILFLISGMGVRFALERRDWKQLLKDRTARILVPFVFGFFFICPINLSVGLKYYGKPTSYIPNPGHLWFLANIFLYVLLLLLPLIVFKNNTNHLAIRFLSRLLFSCGQRIVSVKPLFIFRRPLGLFLIALPLMAEAWLVAPKIFPAYAFTPHGFWLGMVCFVTGFVFISLGDVF